MPNKRSAPDCETCGQPCFNIDRHGDHTGRHMDLSECFRAMGARIRELEKKIKRGAARDLTGGGA